MKVNFRSSSNKKFSGLTRNLKIQQAGTSSKEKLGPSKVELELNADIIFVKLPDIVRTALLRFRRIIVGSNGKVRPLLYEPDEFRQSIHINCHIDQIHRRILCALEKERNRMVQIPDVDKDKENIIGHKCAKVCKDSQARVPPKAAAEESLRQFYAKRQNPDMKSLLSLGLTEAQIYRLENSPLWARLQVNNSEEQTSNQDEEVAECRPKTSNNSSEQDSEVAVTLRSRPVKKNASRTKANTVIWSDCSWSAFTSFAPQCFNNGHEKILEARRREKLILQMAACMQRMDERKFCELFPMFSKRHDYKNYHRVRLRLVEESINDMLKKLEIAPIYFENWTENEGAIIDIKYLVRCAISFSNYCEAKTIGLALHMQYPEDAVGCDCRDGRCTSSCPCIKIRMRRCGKVDVEKQAEANTIGCGTTCSCSFDCPSRFEEAEECSTCCTAYSDERMVRLRSTNDFKRNFSWYIHRRVGTIPLCVASVPNHREYGKGCGPVPKYRLLQKTFKEPRESMWYSPLCTFCVSHHVVDPRC